MTSSLSYGRFIVDGCSGSRCGREWRHLVFVVVLGEGLRRRLFGVVILLLVALEVQ